MQKFAICDKCSGMVEMEIAHGLGYRGTCKCGQVVVKPHLWGCGPSDKWLKMKPRFRGNL